jgi:hypothetical protein
MITGVFSICCQTRIASPFISFLRGLLSLKHGLLKHKAFSRLIRAPVPSSGPRSVSRSIVSGLWHEFSEQVQGVVAVDGTCSRPLVRSRQRQVAPAHGQCVELGNSGWRWRRGRCPIDQDHGGAEVAQNSDLEGIILTRQCAQLWPALDCRRDRRTRGRICAGAQSRSGHAR